MESARRRMLTDLDAALPAKYIVSDRAAPPDRLPADKLGVRVLTGDVVPILTQRSLQIGLQVWVLTPSQDPAKVDDYLDAALGDVLSAVLGMPTVEFVKAARDTMDDENGGGWYGYRFDVNAYAQY